MDIEDKIRSRIEAILTADARNHAEVERAACDEEPLESDPFAEERNFYQRIINSYRNAISEVNGLLEENVGFLSSFYRMIDAIKDKTDFQAICSHLVHAILQDFRAEYCSVILFPSATPETGDSHLEGVFEERKFFRIHSDPGLLGSVEFEDVLVRMITETGECLNIGDVYREPRFNDVDFPSVVRSLMALPIAVGQKEMGCLILSHSLPSCFNENHLRVLKILAGMLAFIRLHTLRTEPHGEIVSTAAPVIPDTDTASDAFSLVMLDFVQIVGPGQIARPDKKHLLAIRARLAEVLKGAASVFLHDEGELLVLLPAVSSAQLPEAVGWLQQAFRRWRESQGEAGQRIKMNLGFSTCDGSEELSRMLELAALAMRPETDEGWRTAAIGS
jgi:hypothetical protein